MKRPAKKYGCKICKKPSLLGWPDWICYDCKEKRGDFDFDSETKQTRLDSFGEEE